VVSESLLTDDVRAMIGKAGAPIAVVVDVKAVRHSQETFLGAVGVIPPAGERVPGYALAALGADTEMLGVPDLLPNSLLVSNEWSFERPILMGEALTAQARVADIAERFGGRFGYGVHVRTEVDFRDAEGALVAQSSTTLMYYDASDSRE
jgi:N-terminal half of MaoC dehydratase